MRKVLDDKEAIHVWMRMHPSLDIGEKPLKDLYPLARKLGIKNYSRLSRLNLLVEIRHAEEVYGPQ